MRRPKSWGTAALAAAMLLAACGGAAEERDDADKADVELTLLDETRAAKTVHYTGGVRRLAADDDAPPSDEHFSIRFEGAIDFDTGVASSSFRAPSGQGEEQVSISDERFVYSRTDGWDFVPIGLDLEGYDWLRMEVPDRNMGILGRGDTSDVFSLLDRLDAADVVEGPRTERLDGEEVSYYKVRVERDDAVEFPDGFEPPERDPYTHLWFDEEGRLRRSRSTEVMWESTIDYERYGEPVDVEVPSGPRVLDGGALPIAQEPDYDELGPWQRLAAGEAGVTTWEVWHASVGPDYGCWTFESSPRIEPLTGGLSSIVGGALPDEFPEHDGEPANCELEPAVGLVTQAVKPLTPTPATTGSHQLFVAVAVDDVTGATVTRSDGSTSAAHLDERHVISWSGAGPEAVVRVEAPLRDGRVVVCAPLEEVPGLEDMTDSQLYCKVSGRAG